MVSHAQDWLAKIRALRLPHSVRIMNVCGGHERAIALAGLRSVLPKNIQLIPGPGCPVCICPEEDIDQAIQWALHQPVTLACFGDMLRVPINVPRGATRSLEEARAAGADVRPIASPQEALRLAREHPKRPVIFHAVGFETTLAPVAALLAEGIPNNLFLLMSGRLTWPAVALLLNSGEIGLDALIAPGHVSTVMGPEEWEFVATQHGVPVAIAGFTADSVLAAIFAVLEQICSMRAAPASSSVESASVSIPNPVAAGRGVAVLKNCYSLAVKPGGNPRARRYLAECFEVIDAPWRGIGVIPRSGYALREPYTAHDACRHFPRTDAGTRRRAGEMPPGCDCARVVLGRIVPPECRLYGSPCTPRAPVGPCMVSEEGACRIWWSSGIRE